MPESKSFSLQEIFLRHAHEVGAFIRGRWPKEQDVGDIAQETFLRLSQYPSPETINDPRAFLFRTASNLSVERHRRRKIREHHAEPEADFEHITDPRAHPERHWEMHEALEHFSAWLEELPELRRHAFILYRLEGLAHAEIAERLGISVRCSERYVKLAMQHIAARLDSVEEKKH